MSDSSLRVSRARTGWWAVGGLLLLVVAFVFYSFVGTFVFGIFIYYATRPIYARIRRRVRPPSVAAAVSLLLIALPVILAAALDDLRATDAVVPEADTPTGVPRVVDDGTVVTCGGVTSGLDLAFHLVEREFGASVADRVAETMEYERRF